MLDSQINTKCPGKHIILARAGWCFGAVLSPFWCYGHFFCHWRDIAQCGRPASRTTLGGSIGEAFHGEEVGPCRGIPILSEGAVITAAVRLVEVVDGRIGDGVHSCERLAERLSSDFMRGTLDGSVVVVDVVAGVRGRCCWLRLDTLTVM